MIDEVETIQRMRSDSRAKALNALRQWIDELDSGRYPGLYLLITGTPAFFDGRMGVQSLPPLAQRLATDFTTDPRFDNPRAPQIRLRNFDIDRLVEVGTRSVRCTPTAPETRRASGPWSMMPTSGISHERWQESWAGRWGWRRDFSSRSSSSTSSTGWTYTPTSILGATTR